MKHNLIIILLFCSGIRALTPKPYLAVRSQGQDATLDLIGLVPHINKPRCNFYQVYAITPKYEQSFFHNRIADNLFGNDLESDTLSAIHVTGSNIRNRNTQKDWLADYFGLPADHNGTMRFEPVTSSFICDLYGYFGLNNIMNGLFVTVHIPVVRNKRSLNFFEVVEQDGISNYPPGYFSPTALLEFTGVDREAIGIKRADLLDNMTDFLFRQKTPDVAPVIFDPLNRARIAPEDICCRKVKWGIADIQAVLGWNFFQKRWCHFGVGIRTVIPTGTRPSGQFLFEPIIGNGHHWELGAQIWGHRMFCASENLEKQWISYFLIDITHMFKARQCRTFDLQCNPNSRWMLAERFTATVQHLRASPLPDDLTDLVTPSAQFAGELSPVANLTTRSVEVSANIQCDAVFMLTYIKRRMSIDFGYNGWYRSCEKIKKRKHCSPTPLENNLWALKGTSFVYGFTKAQGIPPVPDNTPVALSATQSQATIHAGAPDIDNPAFAAAVFYDTPVILNNNIVNNQQAETSLNPICIQENQLDLHNAATKGFSNKLFFHLSYVFDAGTACYVPFFGFGFALEAGNNNIPQNRTLQSCQNCALSQFIIWVRGGWSY